MGVVASDIVVAGTHLLNQRLKLSITVIGFCVASVPLLIFQQLFDYFLVIIVIGYLSGYIINILLRISHEVFRA